MIKKTIEQAISHLQENKDTIDGIFCITINNNDRMQSNTSITVEQLRDVLYTMACDDIRIGGAILQTAMKLANDINKKKMSSKLTIYKLLKTLNKNEEDSNKRYRQHP